MRASVATAAVGRGLDAAPLPVRVPGVRVPAAPRSHPARPAAGRHGEG